MTGHQTTNSVRLPGLDGSNPLGFLAALGVLRILDHVARARRRPLPRMRWIEVGHWQPEIESGADSGLDDVISAILEDKATWVDDPALMLAYDSTGTELVDPRGGSQGIVRDLKPRPAVMRLFLGRLVVSAEVPDLDFAYRLAVRRSLDTAGFYGSEVVQDNNGNTKPFALHFSAGQQTFLKAVAQLQSGVGEADLVEALSGPWRGTSKLPSMSWDATVARIYALRASDPSSEKRGSNPGADWLAFVGLGFLSAVPHGGALLTTGVRGGWKGGSFTWPVWTSPLTGRVVRSLLALQVLQGVSARERALRGIGAVFSSRITRSDQGGYGGFSPAKVV
ncbi:MAG TPA: hypothetical protein VLH75_19345 [Longimicrobiales bacterium]|nr:hypothetical protein [Longimicrobiales bacterium]